MTKSRMNHHGFSLLELMVVIVILGLLAGVVLPRMIGVGDDARINTARTQIQGIETAIKMYKLDNGVYPSTEQGLDALVSPPEVGQLPKKWRKGGYMEKGIPKDPWGNDYLYLSPGINNTYSFDLFSYGPDGQPGGDDEGKDINNWEVE